MLGYGIKKGVLTPTQQSNIVNLLTRGIVGTGIIAPTAAYMFDKGLLVGKEKQDFQAQNLKSETGMLPYSAKIGDTYTTIDWIQPLSYTMLAVGEYMKGGKDDTTYYDSIISGLENTFNIYGEHPASQSIIKLTGKYDKEASFGELVAASGVSGLTTLVPTLSGQTATYQDKNKRELYSPSFWEKHLINPIKNKIPGLRETLPEKVGILGETQQEYFGKNDLINSFVARWRTGEYKPNPVEKEILTIYDKTKDVEVIPYKSPKVIRYGDNKEYVLTGADRSEYQKLLGSYVTNQIARLIEVPSYKRLKTDALKASEIKKVIANSSEYAKDEFLKSKNIEIPKIKNVKSKVEIPKIKEKGKY